MTTLNRRQFLRDAALSAGGLCIAVPLGQALALEIHPKQYSVNTAYIRIPKVGPVVFVMPKVEMGQGIYTGLALLIAEELELRLDQVRVEPAPPLPAVYGVDGDQSTGGSTSTRDCWQRLRQAGATVRQWLLESAADHWHVPLNECRAHEGVITHTASQRELSYAACAAIAQARPLPSVVKLKKPAEFTLIGKSTRRIDSALKVDGSAEFGIDVRLPQQVYARVALSPTLGGHIKHCDSAAGLAVAGVIQVVNEHDVIAVIARHNHAAQVGLEALKLEWHDGPYASVNQADLMTALHTAMHSSAGAIAHQHQAAHAPMSGAQRVHKAEYFQPLLAHATLEPLNATVHVTGTTVRIWTGTQAPDRLVEHVARLGFNPANIHVYNQLIGGGFGRRLDVDFVEIAVRIAKHHPAPVQVTYSREQDMQHDRYRPCYLDQLEATLDAHGTPIRWVHKIAGGSASVPWDGKALTKGVDADAVEGAANLPYQLPSVDVRYLRVEPKAVAISWWRGVGPTRSVLVVESFIDELAHLCQADPIEYRLRWLHDPRARHCLTTLAELAHWQTPLPANHGRGVSVHAEFGSYLAQVVEVEVVDRQIMVRKVISVMDCGIVVNPAQVKAQIEGGSIFGLTAALCGNVTLSKGAVEQSNFHDYPVMRVNEAPSFESVLIASEHNPGGVGETATACIQAALLNAIFNATQQRIRSLPIRLTEA